MGKQYYKEDVNIDMIKIPRDIKDFIKRCEKLSEEKEELLYCEYVEFLDYMCKEACVQNHLSQSEWDLIMRRYDP